ncbi:hypothetical protein TEA_015646 [Camellia sinensis var. sinensis]|uniref:non-specific serine/threonine protein kinase n=1 Tax=Camellia sinensis var. sinensis TaxID=542762 RepID=A0A4S4EFY2_CAMSN|nr:hypothetical protein TEA_015646 [Camellia sinensis var. sinensis]
MVVVAVAGGFGEMRGVVEGMCWKEVESFEMDGCDAKASTSSKNLMSNYRLGKTLGAGASGKVKLALHIVTGIKVAIKILARQSIDDSAAEKGAFLEMDGSDAKASTSSKNLLSNYRLGKTLGAGASGKVKLALHIVTGIKVAIKILARQSIDDSAAEKGVECCHLHMVVHRDLKPENLLLNSEHNLKIADFGLSNIMRDGHFLKTSCGSPNYAAPEVISDRLYAGPEVDVWSCGVTLYALLCGRLPFDDDNLPGLYAKIKNGVYTLPNQLSHGARDLIARILTIDPINRISIPEIRQHPWFQQDLPQYIAMPSVIAAYDTKKINEGIILEMAKMGFDIHEVIGSLQNGLENKATVTYYLLADSHFRVHHNYLKNELLELLPPVHVHPDETYTRPPAPVQKKWALGFQSQISPRETMTVVLKVLEKLNVRWKEIGHYNMKCLWAPEFSAYPKNTLNGGPTLINDVYGLESSIISTSILGIRLQNALKFEIQLYKASEETYLLDLQRIHGPPFLFLEICAAFFALVA